MSLDELLSRLEWKAASQEVTPVTPARNQGLPLKATDGGAVTLVTPVTPKKIEAESNARNRRAVIRFRLKAGQGGGVAVGECSADELMGDLRQRYGQRLGSCEEVI